VARSGDGNRSGPGVPLYGVRRMNIAFASSEGPKYESPAVQAQSRDGGAYVARLQALNVAR
jgi:hypothetical protein